MVLDGVDLEVAPGSVCALLGPNGAGKTTAVRIVTTLTRPDGGRVEAAGLDVVRHPRAVRRRIGLIGQQPAVDDLLGARQDLVLFARLHHLDRRAASVRAEELCHRRRVEPGGRHGDGRPRTAGVAGRGRRRVGDLPTTRKLAAGHWGWPYAQQLGDALVQLADNALASGDLPILRTAKPHVVVMIDVDGLADPATRPGSGEMGFGATISAARARWLACDGNVSRVVMGPEGQVLDHGRSKRIVPRGLRTAAEIEQRHCVFAGCEAPTHWCDVHHVLEWVLDEGPTSLENSALLCERHHSKVHHGFRVERQPDGRWRTWRPDGTEILVPVPL